MQLLALHFFFTCAQVLPSIDGCPEVLIEFRDLNNS